MIDEKSCIEVFDDIQSMISKSCFWGAITFIDWQEDEEMNEIKSFVEYALSFFVENKLKFLKNEFFTNDELKNINDKFNKIKSKVDSYYKSMDKDNLMDLGKNTTAVVYLFGEIPVKRPDK